MKGKIVFNNQSSRIAAAHIGKQRYIVFEYGPNERFDIDDELLEVVDSFGTNVCKRVATNKNVRINVLSSAMSYTKAKLVVAPWQDDITAGTDVVC